MLFREEDEDQEILPFENRAEAGRILAGKLVRYRAGADLVVVGLARGGVSVASEVAEELQLPLDVLVVRKIAAPWNRELAMGAIAAGGIGVLDLSVAKDVSVSDDTVMHLAELELPELQRCDQLYHRDHAAIAVDGKTVILVDDGAATGCSILAAVTTLRRQQAKRVVVAMPVAVVSAFHAIRAEADELVCIAEPESFRAVSQWYDDFSEVSDDDVRALLERANIATLCAA